jgi:site-specific recombinase
MMRGKARATVGVDYLVAAARADAPAAERLEWLEQAAAWIRARGRGGEVEGGAASPSVRLRFLVQVLERNPERRAEVARMLRVTLRELNAVPLLCETGLPRANAFFQELGGRIAAKFLPAPPASPDLATLFLRAFPDESDADWIAALPVPLLEALGALLRDGAEGAEADPWSALQRDAEDALVVLASQAQAIGLSARVRRRVATGRPLDSPFAGMVASVREFVEAPPGSPESSEALAVLASRIARCRRALADVHGHLESYGVSIDLVFQLERARIALARMEALTALRSGRAADPQAAARFAARLVRANAAQDSVGALFAGNGKLLARRIVDSARKTGEHYITHDAAEYRAMLWSAAIGGAVTGLTVLVKLAATGDGLPPFVQGVTASLNYSVSFVAIHLLHGTLATKQPAMTAAALAAKLGAGHARRRLRGFVDEVADLVRSQVAAIAGNLLLVAPVALALQAALLLAGGAHLPDPEHALHYVEALGVLGPTPVYAAFTGVLLWLSAVIAGWFENWATYRRLPEAIAHAPRLVAWLGPERAARFAGVIDGNVAALGGNVALGFMLGMTPEVAGFFGLPLDVRHVTLSTGQLALAAYAYGAEILWQPAFWLAGTGIVAIGAMNLTVSFGLALFVAVRATGVGAVSRRRLRRVLLARLVASPRDFLLPPRQAPAARPPR